MHHQLSDVRREQIHHTMPYDHLRRQRELVILRRMQSKNQTILAEFKDQIGNRAEQCLVKLLAALEGFVDVGNVSGAFSRFRRLG